MTTKEQHLRNAEECEADARFLQGLKDLWLIHQGHPMSFPQPTLWGMDQDIRRLKGMAKKHRKLAEEAEVRPVMLCRHVYPGDPPPADPPNGHCKWSTIDGEWLETDAHLRDRIKEANKP